jgi:hypothetical protein
MSTNGPNFFGDTGKFNAYVHQIHSDSRFLDQIQSLQEMDLQNPDTSIRDNIKQNAAIMIQSILDNLTSLNDDTREIQIRITALNIIREVTGDEPFTTHLREGENVDQFFNRLYKKYRIKETSLLDKAKRLPGKVFDLFRLK